MKILVLGAGLLGTLSAWYLHRDGHEVTVIDRQPGAALETSFANGSQISVSYAEPWANPAAPWKILKWLGQEDAPLLFRLRADPHQWLWALAFLRECTPARTRHNTIQLTNLGLYSRTRLQALRQALGLAYDHLEKGILHLYQTEQDYNEARPGLELMQELGCRIDLVTPDEIVALEPALSAYRSRLAGGAYAPDDESGDAYKFIHALAAHSAGEGIRFRYDTTITSLQSGSGKIDGVHIASRGGHTEMLKADAYVLCMGSWSAPLLRSVGLPARIYPVKGYSATLPVKPGALASTISLTDHARKIVISRLGERIRIAGTAELNGYDASLNPMRCNALLRRAQEFFPDVLELEQAQFWTGLRPATPSNIPYIGRSGLDNLWLNTGHGTLGWTHGAGSGRALADLIGKRKPEVDFEFCGLAQ